MTTQNPVALVTGATGIIGPAICRTLAREGYRVAACASSMASFDRLRSYDDRPLDEAARFDSPLDGREACHALVRRVEDALGPVALLVNNAGLNAQAHSPTLDSISEKTAAEIMNVNCLCPMWLIQAAEPSLVATGGSVVSMSTVQVKKHFKRSLMYQTAKAALEGLTTSLALELGGKGVRVNAIRVGAIPGIGLIRPYLDKLSKDKARQLYADIMPKHIASSQWMTLLPNHGTPEDVAELTAFFASDRAKFINGAIIDLDSGFGAASDRGRAGPLPSAADAVQAWLGQHAPELAD